MKAPTPPVTAAKKRATAAIRRILANRTNDRSFDSLFESGDGSMVVTFIIARAIQNTPLRTALARWHGGELVDGMPKAWLETYSRVMPTLN